MTSDVCLVHPALFLRHEEPDGHPESAARLRAVLELFDESPDIAALPRIAPKRPEDARLLAVHGAEMVRIVKEQEGRSGYFDSDTYFAPESVAVALEAAGATIDAALAIQRGDFRRGFSLVRPPGHHATPFQPMGFCLFNNVALAAAALRAEAPASRVAIVDFDLHHGNGTQDAFFGDPDVLFISSHRYPFYPGTGALEELGTGRGKGLTVNFPLAERFQDDFFVSLYGGIVAPMLRAFRPDFILVSAGFDGHARDPMHGFRLSTAAFGALAEILVAEAEVTTGKILFCLEGGYDVGALKDSVREVFAKLRGLPRTPFTAGQRPVVDAPELAQFREVHGAAFPELR